MRPSGLVHFMGIGGAGMSGIARIMAMRGWPVSGCDAKDSRALTGLRALGVDVSIGHDVAHVEDIDMLVYSSAIRPDHPELSAARTAGIRVLQRAEALAALMEGRDVIAVAGTHGKTTTTSMIAVALQHAGLDPSFAIGGTLSDSGANAHDGSGSIFVAEADESDGSFLHYRPRVAVITNIEADHLDHYVDLDAVKRAFTEFVGSVSGAVVGCADDPLALELTRSVHGITYGTTQDADLRIDRLELRPLSFLARWRGGELGEVHLRVPGRHNALNAAAALAVGMTLEVDPAAMIDGLAHFSGTRRRFETRGQRGDVVVIDDYAHHPTEIAATISAARDVYPGSQVVAVFQPHRYSRTAAFLEEFAGALSLADRVIVTEVYAAGEQAIPGASGAALARALAARGARVIFEPALMALPHAVAETVEGPSCILAMGAGDITLIAPDILTALH